MCVVCVCVILFLFVGVLFNKFVCGNITKKAERRLFICMNMPTPMCTTTHICMKQLVVTIKQGTGRARLSIAQHNHSVLS